MTGDSGKLHLSLTHWMSCSFPRQAILKFYPLLDVSREQREAYIKDYLLPFHPLQSKGYFSVGCVQCTKPGKGRTGRWNNSPKTECGLHL